MLDDETVITLAEAARRCPGGGVSFSTVWRWTTHGVKGNKLESIVCGGRRLTSVEALRRFVARGSAQDTPALASSATNGG